MKEDSPALPRGVIGAAVSGGMDSMCLLHYLVNNGADVVALTVQHGIRGADSLSDAALVENYCRTLGVPCLRRDVDAPRYAAEHHLSLEHAARELRHAFFAEVLTSGRVDYVATAHHLDDQCETVLLNLLRGAGLRGMAGMAGRETYLRPFLDRTRREIAAYAREYSVPYREDATNSDPTFNRNYLRAEVLPLLERRFPAYRQGVARMTAAMREQINLLDSLSTPIALEDGVVFLPLSALACHPALAKWNVLSALRRFDGGVDCEAHHIEAILALPATAHGMASLPHDLMAAREYDRIAFWRKAPIDPALTYPFAEGTFTFGDATYTVRPARESDNLYFDVDKVPKEAVVRLRQPGDFIAKFGGGTKSLGDYYTDKKVPLRVRDATPVVAVGHRILLCAADISSDIAADDGTRRLYTMTKTNATKEN